MLQVTFPEIVRTLEGLSSSVPAAESHGCLCGALCVASHYTLERWLEEIVPDEALEGGAGAEQESETDGHALDPRAPLRLLFADTLRSLRGDDMDLELLLPDDDSALASRARALSEWCQGFLYGFGTGIAFESGELPANVDEILRDLAHIGRADVELGEASEQEEAAYAEILEYVRVGVQLIHDELLAARAQQGVDAGGRRRQGPSAREPNERNHRDLLQAFESEEDTDQGAWDSGSSDVSEDTPPKPPRLN